MADPSIERFRRVVSSAYASLEVRRQEVNDLNVFPVADGDTGDNMAMTMRAVMEELDRLHGAEIVTVIGGAEAPIPLAEIGAHIPDRVELDVHDGGQPGWWWLLAAQ